MGFVKAPVLTVLSEYVAGIFDKIKERPLFLVRNEFANGRIMPQIEERTDPKHRWENLSSVASHIPAALLALAIVLGAYLRLRSMGVIWEDAFIHFRFARNLALGLGFVYNPGERVLGSSSPLYTIALALFQVAGADMAKSAMFLGLVADGGTILFVYLIARTIAGPWAAAIGSLLYATSNSNIQVATSGMETALFGLVVTAALYSYIRGRHTATTILCGLAPLIRAEGIILSALVVLVYLIRDRQVPFGNWRNWAIGAAIFIPWLAFATFYFGSPIPNTLEAKRVAYQLPPLQSASILAGQMAIPFPGNPLPTKGTIAALLFLAGTLTLRSSRGIVMPLWFLSYFVVTTSLGTRFYALWYSPPMWASYLIVASIGGVRLWSGSLQRLMSLAPLHRLRFGFRALALAVAASVVLGATVLNTARALSYDWRSDPEYAFQEETAIPLSTYLKEQSRGQDVVLLEHIGAIGWYSGLQILDQSGLVSPEVIPLNRRAKEFAGRRINYFEILNKFQPSYYIAWPSLDILALKSDPYQWRWTEENYSYVRDFGSGPNRLSLYRKKQGKESAPHMPDKRDRQTIEPSILPHG